MVIMTRRSCTKIKTTIRLLLVAINYKRDHLIHQIYNNHIMAISHHMPCKNKLDASYLFLQILRGLGLSMKNHFLPTNKNHNDDNQVVSMTPFRALRCKSDIHYSKRDRHPLAAYVIQVTCRAQNQSRVSVRVKSVRAASSNYATNIN